MYEQHWGLARLGYQNLPDPSTFFPFSQHRRALSLLHHAVQNDKGTVLLTGETGSRKTTLTRALVLQLAEDKFEVGVPTNPSLPPREFLEEINVQFGTPAGPSAQAELLRARNSDPMLSLGQGRTTVLIVD